LEVAGILTTSLTMSCYYLFLGLYLRDRFFGGNNNAFMWWIFALFAVRIALHYNPANIWVSMVLPHGEPNHAFLAVVATGILCSVVAFSYRALSYIFD
jgi:hypothetical protein